MTDPVTIGRATHIYAICDGAGVVRYVGKTVRTPAQRFAQHKIAARNSHLPFGRWLNKHPEAVVHLLEVVGPEADWASRETYWICQFDNLLNLTVGGEGLAGLKFSAEHRAKIGQSLRTGASFSCETCGSEFWRKPHAIKKGDCRFCSRECYAKSQKGVSKPFPAIAILRGNAARMAARKAQTHCKRGHPLSGDNLFHTTSGSRGCKACRAIHKQTYRSKAHG